MPNFFKTLCAVKGFNIKAAFLLFCCHLIYMIQNCCLLVLAVVLSSCWYLYKDPGNYQPRKVMGYKPVYNTDSTLLRIYTDTARPIKNAGKIYVYGNYILQNEIGHGIHIIDRTNPSKTKNIGFVSIRGNTELSIKDNFLYANSFNDLVVVNITNWQQPKEVKRIPYAFAHGMQNSYNLYLPPPERNVSYECVDFTKGIHTGWVKDSVYEYSCYY